MQQVFAKKIAQSFNVCRMLISTTGQAHRERYMRKTIKVDDDVWVEFKEQCKKIGRDYHWVTEELLKNWVVKQQKKA